MAWYNRQPRREEFDTEEEFKEALDLFEWSIQEREDELVERRHMEEEYN